MNWQLLWFVLAGFVVGFAVSTLWEWVYYRGLRQRALAQRAAVREYPVTASESAPAPGVTTADAPVEAGYRTPAVFIEGERPGSTAQPSYEPLVASWTPPPPQVASTDVREGSPS